MTNLLNELYEKKLRSNCNYEQINDSIIIYLGMDQFIIVNNYFGVIAVGVRGFSYEKQTSYIKYKLVNDSVSEVKVRKLIKKYENKLRVAHCIIDNNYVL